jgi:hypothetical protein
MLSLRAHFAFPTLFLAVGLFSVACSKDERTALLVDVSLESATVALDRVDIVVSRLTQTDGGAAKFTSQFPWSGAGTLKATLLLPAEVAGIDDVEVKGTNGVAVTATAQLSGITITAGKATGPIKVLLKPIVPIVPTVDGGVDALPSDGPQPDLSVEPEVGKPEAGVTPDTSIDQPGPEAGAPDAPVPSDVVQPVEVEPSPDALQLSDVADAGADAPRPTDAGVDAPQPADAVEAGADTGPDSLAAPAWQPVENVVNDPFSYANASAVAVDPVKEHVYVMWIEWATGTVNVRRWNRTTTSWEPTHTLEENGNGDPRDSQIGVDGAGHVTATWFHYEPKDTTLLGVRSSQSTDGVSWSTPARITPNRQVAETSLAVARNGTARLAFTEYNAENHYIPLLYSAYYDGMTWTAGPDALAAQPDVPSPHYPSPSVAISEQGNGIILFTQMDDQFNDSVAVATFAGTTLDPYILLDSNTSNSIEERAVVVNRNGQGAVVWGDNGAMLSSYSPSTKTWTEAQKIGNVGLRQPTMVMASDGTITLAWSQESNSGYFNVWTMEGTAGGTWTKPTALETDNLSIEVNFLDNNFGPLPFPTLAIDATDNVLLVWSKKTQATPPREFGVYGRRKLAGSAGVWQPATELARKFLQPWGLSLGVSDKGLGAAGYYWDDPDGTNDPASSQVFVSLFR